jgi:hypothetical protein
MIYLPHLNVISLSMTLECDLLINETLDIIIDTPGMSIYSSSSSLAVGTSSTGAFYGFWDPFLVET